MLDSRELRRVGLYLPVIANDGGRVGLSFSKTVLGNKVDRIPDV